VFFFFFFTKLGLLIHAQKIIKIRQTRMQRHSKKRLTSRKEALKTAQFQAKYLVFTVGQNDELL